MPETSKEKVERNQLTGFHRLVTIWIAELIIPRPHIVMTPMSSIVINVSQSTMKRFMPKTVTPKNMQITMLRIAKKYAQDMDPNMKTGMLHGVSSILSRRPGFAIF